MDRHINLGKLDAVLRGFNLALQWNPSVIHLCTDLTCMRHWIYDTLFEKMRVHTKAVLEILIKC